MCPSASVWHDTKVQVNILYTLKFCLYINDHMYICVCVCVCGVCILCENVLDNNNQANIFYQQTT